MIKHYIQNIRNQKFIVSLLVISFVLRVLFSIGNNCALFIDVKSYEDFAVRILNEGVFSVSTYHPPAYIFFIAAIYKIFGYSYLYVYMAQSILGVVNTLLIYLIARNIFGERIGKISAASSLLYWPLTLYSGLLLSEIVFIFFLLASIYVFIKGVDSNKPGYFAICGVLAALSALTRSINLLWLILLPLIYVYFYRKNMKPCFKNILLFVVMFGVTLSPWVIRNYIMYHELIPVDSLGGVNLYIGNNEKANGFFVQIDDAEIQKRHLSIPEYDQEMKSSAVNYIVSHPLKFLSLTVWRAFVFTIFDFVEVDWTITTYMNQHFLFQNNVWNLQIINLCLLLAGIVMVVLLVLFRKTMKRKHYMIFLYFSGVILLYYMLYGFRKFIWNVLPGILDFFQVGAEAKRLIIQTGAPMNGWYTLIYFSNILFFMLALWSLPKLLKNRKGIILLTMIVYYFGLTSVFYIQSRYRLPIMPFMSVSIAISVERIHSFVKRRLLLKEEKQDIIMHSPVH